jgi:hypothetical protein
MYSKFERMRWYRLKLNPLKRASGVQPEKFLGFIIHKHGIVIDPESPKPDLKKQDAARKNKLSRKIYSKPSRRKYLRRFIVNLADFLYICLYVCFFKYISLFINILDEI